MQQKRESPGAVGAARGAGVSALSHTNRHSGPGRRAQARKARTTTFSDWMQTDAPGQFGLYDESVARIRRCMARPEMRGVTSIDGLIDSLRWLRKPFYSTDPLAWKRFELAARALWWAYRGRVP
jgi:hypothetical protein